MFEFCEQISAIPIVGYSCRVYRGFLNYLYTERIESLEFDVILGMKNLLPFKFGQLRSLLI